MSIWGKVIGGVAGFALGGPLGALLGAFAGHQMDKSRRGRIEAPGFAGGDDLASRQLAFTIAVVVLSAKMAKADGQVTRDEIEAFKQAFRIPPEEMPRVGKLWDEARQDATGAGPYAEQIAQMFAGDRGVLEELLGGLFHIAKADGVVHPEELKYLSMVASIFGFDGNEFERIKAVHMGPDKSGAYQVLGVEADAPDQDIKKAYRALSRQYHPDTLIAQGLPQEFIDLANEKMMTINDAYDRICKQRGLK